MYNNAIEFDYAILVGVSQGQIIDETDLDELADLCETCHIKTVGRAVQNIKSVDVTFHIGSGKVDEIAEMVRELNATAVVFDIELSGSKVRNLQAKLNVPVLDRSKVILDIFAARAKTAEGKLQVELAQLKYNLPRLAHSNGLMGKMRNAVGMRGPGEKKLELDRRRIRDEILFLEKKLLEVKKVREVGHNGRGGKPRVCIVGYTNSGKSTLLNTITKAGVYEKDELFATLDTTTRSVYLGEISILLTDTVGFINKLPHEFIHAFESTLMETKDADLLLHIVDISNKDHEKQIAVVNEVLRNIGAEKIPQIMVYNKIDKGEIAETDKNAVYISAKLNKNIDILRQKIAETLSGMV
jgi:GTP-binding protein HflX